MPVPNMKSNLLRILQGSTWQKSLQNTPYGLTDQTTVPTAAVGPKSNSPSSALTSSSHSRFPLPWQVLQQVQVVCLVRNPKLSSRKVRTLSGFIFASCGVAIQCTVTVCHESTERCPRESPGSQAWFFLPH